MDYQTVPRAPEVHQRHHASTVLYTGCSRELGVPQQPILWTNHGPGLQGTDGGCHEALEAHKECLMHVDGS